MEGHNWNLYSKIELFAKPQRLIGGAGEWIQEHKKYCLFLIKNLKMGIIKKARIIDFSIAKEEKEKYTNQLTPEERLKYLEHLREINLGPKVKEPIKRILQIISE